MFRSERTRIESFVAFSCGHGGTVRRCTTQRALGEDARGLGEEDLGSPEMRDDQCGSAVQREVSRGWTQAVCSSVLLRRGYFGRHAVPSSRTLRKCL